MSTTFTPPLEPTPGNKTRSVKPRILSAQFGDGYRQEAGDGLNYLPNSLDLTWAVLMPDQADTIENFFIAQKGYLAFLWTPSNETLERQWKCTNWSRSDPTAATQSITAHFEEVFDL